MGGTLGPPQRTSQGGRDRISICPRLDQSRGDCFYICQSALGGHWALSDYWIALLIETEDFRLLDLIGGVHRECMHVHMHSRPLVAPPQYLYQSLSCIRHLPSWLRGSNCCKLGECKRLGSMFAPTCPYSRQSAHCSSRSKAHSVQKHTLRRSRTIFSFKVHF